MLEAKIKRLKNKEFRDAYVGSHLSQGIAYQIRALRMQRGWTQEQLAQKLGLKRQSAVARMEDPSYGRLSIATLLKLSSIFDVALSVRFCSYGKFLLEREDLSPDGLSAESFEEEAPRILEDIETVTHYCAESVQKFSSGDYYLPSSTLPTSATKYLMLNDRAQGVTA